MMVSPTKNGMLSLAWLTVATLAMRRQDLARDISLVLIPLLSQTPPIVSPQPTPTRKGASVTTRRLFTAAVILAMLSGPALAQSNDPLIGTWKLNVAKSKGVKSGSTVIEAAGKGIKFTVDLVPVDGAATHWAFTANYDGKDYPVTGNSPYGNAVSLTRVDARTLKITSKQGTTPTTTSTIVVSEDGKTRTTTIKGTDVKGQPVDVVSVYEKQ